MRKYLPIILIIAVLAVCCYLWASRERTHVPRITGPALRVWFLDSAFDNTIVIRTPERNVYVLDPDSDTAQDLCDFLRQNGARSVSIIITNPTPDRARGLESFIKLIKVTSLLHSSYDNRSQIWKHALESAADKGIFEKILSRGDIVRMSSTVKMEVLNPPKEPLKDTGQNNDNNSLVLKIGIGGKHILLASDTRIAAEGDMISSGIDLTSNVFSIARHGCYGSTSLEMICKVRPEICVISAGKGMDRPTTTVLNRLDVKNTGAELYRTDKSGVIEVVSDGHSILVNTEVANDE